MNKDKYILYKKLDIIVDKINAFIYDFGIIHKANKFNNKVGYHYIFFNDDYRYNCIFDKLSFCFLSKI